MSNTATNDKKYFYLTLGLLGLFYIPVLYDLVIDWATDANYSHGFLVPVISGYLLWRKRKELSDVMVSPNNLGLLVIMAGAGLFILGNAAAEYFTVRLSLLVILFGLVLYHWGGGFVKKTWFEIAFLFFMIPIPYVIYFSATFPMQLLASKVTTGILQAIGMTVVRKGNIIHLPNESLEVAEACSGLRSLISLLALGAIYAYITQKTFFAKLILFLSTIPIAVAGNVFRVFITAILVYTVDAEVTAEPLHSIMGAMVFIVAFILLFIFGSILRRIFR